MSSPSTHHTPKVLIKAWLFFGSFFMVFLALDQLTKWWAEKNLTLGASTDLGFVLHFNSGVAFSTQLPIWSIYLLTGLILLLGFWMVIKEKLWRDKIHLLGLALIASGAIGNLVDRLRLGYVIDFIKVYFWPIFNLADVWIMVGILLIALKTLFRPHFGEDI